MKSSKFVPAEADKHHKENLAILQDKKPPRHQKSNQELAHEKIKRLKK